MFRIEPKRKTKLMAAMEIAEVTYHATVRSARGNHSNALFGLMFNILYSAIFIIAPYVTMTLLGWRSNTFRGDFVLFLITGVSSYMTYNKTMKSVYSSEGPVSAMMLHAPMNTMVTIASAALSSLYIQVLTIIVILFVYHVVFTPITINDPRFAVTMLLAAWIFGIATGLSLLALRPWAPKLAPLLLAIVSRVNIFASGKMMVGNQLSFTLLHLFSWNPLFHIIDQLRGAVFLNYNPRNSSIPYIFWVSFTLIAIGLMGEFFARKRVSISWFAR